jgi:hypothetical protein
MMPANRPIHLIVFGNILRNRNRRISQNCCLSRCRNCARMVNIGTQVGARVDSGNQPVRIRSNFFQRDARTIGRSTLNTVLILPDLIYPDGGSNFSRLLLRSFASGYI